MPKPTKQDLSGLDYSWLGQPFVRYAAKSTINTSDLDYSFLAQPFVTAGDVIFASSSFAVTASCLEDIMASKYNLSSSNFSITASCSENVTNQTVYFSGSNFSITASCSQNILAEAIQSQQEEENTIFKVYAQWRNIYSKYKLY